MPLAAELKDRYDVVVVGAGLSGIDAGYRLQTMCPDKDYVILEGREQIGGTWPTRWRPARLSTSTAATCCAA